MKNRRLIKPMTNSKSNRKPKKLFSIPEAADQIGVHHMTLRRWIEAGSRVNGKIEIRGINIRITVLHDRTNRRRYLPEESVRRLAKAKLLVPA